MNASLLGSGEGCMKTSNFVLILNSIHQRTHYNTVLPGEALIRIWKFWLRFFVAFLNLLANAGFVP
jgi:hypothetical protein